MFRLLFQSSFFGKSIADVMQLILDCVVLVALILQHFNPIFKLRLFSVLLCGRFFRMIRHLTFLSRVIELTKLWLFSDTFILVKEYFKFALSVSRSLQ